MSWQAYVDTNLVGTGKVKNAAIFGHNGSEWATSPGFKMTETEAKNIIAAFDDPTNVRANGIFAASEKYFALGCSSNSVYGKKGAGGISIVKTNQAVLIGTYDENSQPGEVNKVVEGLGDYLRSVNY